MMFNVVIISSKPAAATTPAVTRMGLGGFPRSVLGDAVPSGGGSTTLTAEAASFVLTGAAVSTEYNRVMDAGVASYTLTGATVDTLYSRTMVAEAVSFALTGATVDTRYNRRLVAEPASYSLTGSTVSTLYTRILAAEAASFTVTGQDVDTRYNRRLIAEAAAYLLTGSDVTTTVINSETLFADAASFLLTGADAGLLYNQVLAAEAAAFILSGTDVDLLYNPRLAAEPGSFVFTGSDATLFGGSASPGGIYNAVEYFPTSSTVTITLYDPLTGGVVSLDDSSCSEIGSSGIFVWDSSKLTTQPTGYKEYAWRMTDGSTIKGGVINVFDSDDSTKLLEIWQRLGLDSANALTNKSDGGYTVASIDVQATESGDDIIQTRQ